jgi:hypothetical protein
MRAGLDQGREARGKRLARALRLFLDYAAGDSCAGISAGVGLVIVHIGVDHDRSAAGLEERRGTFTQSDVGIQHRSGGVAVGVDFDIGQVAVVRALRIVFTVLLAGGVEVRACGFEVRSFALTHRVDVHSMDAGRKFCNVNINADSTLGGRERRGADFLTGGVEDVGMRGLRELGALLLLGSFGVNWRAGLRAG